MHSHTLLALALVGCGSAPPSSTPSNVSTSTATTVDAQSLGWIGLASAKVHGDTVPAYVSTNPKHPLVVYADAATLPASVRAIGVDGGVQMFTKTGTVQVPYGIEQNVLEVTAFAGPWLTPGVAWVMPPSAPASWQPRPLEIRLGAANETQASFGIGELAFELRRTEPLAGELRIERNGRVLHRERFVRTLMEGADPSPINVSVEGPGVPRPIGAWSLVDGGPLLLVTLHPGYEGVTMRGWLVDADRVRVIEAMEQYLYYGAF